MNENAAQITDEALFDTVTTGIPPEPVTEPAVSSGPPAADPAPVAPPSNPDPAAEPAIPPSRLREEADARRAAERDRDELRQQLEALRRQQPAPPQSVQQSQAQQPKEIWEDPDGFLAAKISPIEQALMRQSERVSRMIAEQTHGKETVSAAFDAMVGAVQAGDREAAFEYQKIMSTDHPYDALVGWHRNRQVITEVGSDPQAYKARIIEEALKDPAVLQRAIEISRGVAQPTAEPARSSSVVSMPSIRNVGTSVNPGGNPRPPSDAELFDSVTASRRR